MNFLSLLLQLEVEEAADFVVWALYLTVALPLLRGIPLNFPLQELELPPVYLL